MKKLDLSKIVAGYYKNITNQEETLYQERMEICKKCPLYKIVKVFGPICNPALYINKDGEVSNTSKPGYIKGCGCILGSKTRLIDSKCIINKW